MRRGLANCSLIASSSLPHDLEEPRAEPRISRYPAISFDDLVELVGDLLALEPGEALQAQIEDGAGLFLGEAIRAVGPMPRARLADELDDRAHVARRPGARHQPLARLDRVRGVADQR